MQMKAVEQYCQVLLFIMMYKVIQTFKTADEKADMWPFTWKLIGRAHDTVYYAEQVHI